MKRLIFISFILLSFISCKKEDIYDEPGYSIGTITKSTNIAYVLTYYYEFKVGNTTYKGNKQGGVSTENDSRMIGRQYLVVYKLSEPSKSDLNFRYPISSEQEFNDLVLGFKDNPPKP